MKKTLTVATLCLMGAGLGLTHVGKAYASNALEQNTPTQLVLQGTTLPTTPGGSGDGPGGGDTTPVAPDTQFGFLFKPHSFDFGTVTNFQLGQPLNQTASGGSVGIGDTRDQAPGWALSVKAGPLTMTKGDVTTSLSGTISMTPTVKYVTYNENGVSKYTLGDVPEAQSKVAPTVASSSVALKTGGASQPVMNAKVGQGSGMWAAELSNVLLSATGNQTGNLSAGTYSGSLTWSLSDTPQQ